MSGYDGAGTFEGQGPDGPDGPDGANVGFGFEWGGPDVSDSNIGAATPNASLSLAEQYAEYGAGRVAAERATAGTGSAMGAGASGYVSTPAQSNAFLATGVTAADQVAASKPGIVETIGRALLSVLGIASGSPQGVISGGLSLNSMFGGKSSTPAASDLGFAGNLGSRSPELFAGGDGPPDTGFLGGAPVLGFDGAPQNQGGNNAGQILFPGLAAGYAPGGGLQYGAGFVPGAQAQPSAAPLLLLAGAASLFFMG